MKFFKKVELLIRMFAAMVTIIMSVPVILAGFIVAGTIDAFQTGMNLDEKLCDWITKD